MKAVLRKAGPVAKAIAGAVVPLIGTSLVGGQVDWRSLAAAAAGALAVYLVPNAKAEAKP